MSSLHFIRAVADDMYVSYGTVGGDPDERLKGPVSALLLDFCCECQSLHTSTNNGQPTVGDRAEQSVRLQ